MSLKVVRAVTRFARRRFSAWTACAGALVAFAAGCLVTARTMHANEAPAERTFQLLVYHAVPGKVPKLEARFGDASALFLKYGIDVVGYWIPNDDPKWADTFVYLIAHPGKDEAIKRWRLFHDDPAFRVYVEQEHQEKLIESVDSTYMRPAPYSGLR